MSILRFLINGFIKTGAKTFWEQYSANTGLVPPNLQGVGMNFIEEHYTRCFDTALKVYGSNDIPISYKQYFTHLYNARLAPLADEQLVIVDASMYSSFVVYFCCLYQLAFLEPTSIDRTKIVKVFFSEVEFHLLCLRGEGQQKGISSKLWLEISSRDEEIMTWAAMSAECLLIYIILHEMGHIFHKHEEFDSSETSDSGLKEYSKHHELEADEFAIDKLYEILSKENAHNLTLDFIYVPVLFFQTLGLIDVYRCDIFHESSMVGEYYPTFSERESRVKKWKYASTVLLDKPSQSLMYLKSLIELARQM